MLLSATSRALRDLIHSPITSYPECSAVVCRRAVVVHVCKREKEREAICLREYFSICFFFTFYTLRFQPQVIRLVCILWKYTRKPSLFEYHFIDMKACCGSKMASLVCAHINLHILRAQEWKLIKIHHLFLCEVASLKLTILKIYKMTFVFLILHYLVFDKVSITITVYLVLGDLKNL